MYLLGMRQWVLSMETGQPLKQRTYSLWLMSSNGQIRVSVVGYQSYQAMEEQLTRCRMGSYFVVIYINYLIPGASEITGKHLDRQLLDDPQRPVEQLLRWHFRQAVLVNMKGAGEPIFEHDFPPGSDMVGSIMESPKAAERMEFEMFSRLATQFDLTE
ncbi:hypothetical protein BJ875DRAFT_509595 [Amylocarpus encephaloides]|uniref:Uncharacterized protein n=1 Tax=Amylocarpus encephaloides TaxID=45428 RepID=A0A9P7YII2_9HELO|nr:hypothetical protein BJ875DRAFT_509595 [Amylocarpus encephaloides]